MLAFPLGLATSTEWLSQAVSTSDAGGSRDGATNDFKKRKNPPVSLGAWVSMKLDLPIDEEDNIDETCRENLQELPP